MLEQKTYEALNKIYKISFKANKKIELIKFLAYILFKYL